MDGRIFSSAEEVKDTLLSLLEDKGGSVKGYVNCVSMPEYGLDCQSRRSESCVVNDGSLSTEVLRVAIWVPRYKK
jgi:hypothetical protein